LLVKKNNDKVMRIMREQKRN